MQHVALQQHLGAQQRRPILRTGAERAVLMRAIRRAHALACFVRQRSEGRHRGHRRWGLRDTCDQWVNVKALARRVTFETANVQPDGVSALVQHVQQFLRVGVNQQMEWTVCGFY